MSNTPMSLEEYKRQVEDYLLNKSKLSATEVSSLMKEYDLTLEGNFEENWDVEVSATEMYMHW